VSVYEYQCAQCGKKFEVRQSIGKGVPKLNCLRAGLTALKKSED
jgi:putative FmdB family regulatory protein